MAALKTALNTFFDVKSLVQATGITQASDSINTERLVALATEILNDNGNGEPGQGLLQLDLQPCYQVAKDHYRKWMRLSVVSTSPTQFNCHC
jgi:hypothetical protein